MAIRIPPNVETVLPPSITKTAGAINNVQSQNRALSDSISRTKKSITNIHNPRDAINALNDVIGTVKDTAAFGKNISGLFKKLKKSGPPESNTHKFIGVQPRLRAEAVDIYPQLPNPPKTFSLSEFVSKIQKDGLAKSNKFRVDISAPRSAVGGPDIMRGLSMMCEAAEFPGRTLEFSEAITYGPSYKMPYTSNYQEITLTLLCDKQLNQKQYFDDWMNFINPTNGFDLEYRENYEAQIAITQFDDLANPTYKCKLIESYPVAVQPLTVSWADDQIQKVMVTICYRYWERMEISGTEANKSLAPLPFQIAIPKAKTAPTIDTPVLVGGGLTGE